MFVDYTPEAMHLVQSHRWTVNHGYAVTYSQGLPSRRFHKALTGNPMTDHKNRDTLDNRMCNLRSTTHLGNQHNLTCPNTKKSGKYPGIYRLRQKQKNEKYEYQWGAQIWYNNKKYNKTFSIQKYGEAKAKKLAALARIDLCKRFDSMNDCPTDADLAEIDIEIAAEVAEV